MPNSDAIDNLRLYYQRSPLMIFLLWFCACGLGGSSRPEYSGAKRVYSIQKGDTLAAVAERFGTSIPLLISINDLDDPDVLEIGQLLYVPATSTSRSAVSKTSMPAYAGGQLVWPVDGGEIISEFGPRSGSFHDGLDIKAPVGRTVRAAHDGTVVYSSNKLSGYGEVVILRSNTSLVTIYAHNSTRDVRVGERVRKGEKIAEIGQTGRASGPHLHFEVRVRDKSDRYVAVDPIPLLAKTSSKERQSVRYRINESLSPLLARLGVIGQ